MDEAAVVSSRLIKVVISSVLSCGRKPVASFHRLFTGIALISHYNSFHMSYLGLLSFYI